MLKNLTILALAGALLPACIITTDNSTDGNSGTEGSAGTGTGTDGTGTDGTGTDGTDSGATDGTAGETTAVPTTGEPTGTGEATGTGGTTGEPSAFGMCGWNSTDKYYGCAAGGADPGVSDPDNIDAIGCPEGLVAGEPCSDADGPVTNIGCCTATGANYYCSGDVIMVEECGA